MAKIRIIVHDGKTMEYIGTKTYYKMRELKEDLEKSEEKGWKMIVQDVELHSRETFDIFNERKKEK